MKRLALSAAVITALLSSSALAQVEMVKEVAVTADVSSIQNERAATYWAGLPDDLQAAILTRMTDRLGDEGARVLVDIEEVALTSAFERQIGLEDAVLVGRVNITDQTDNSNFETYDLSVTLAGVSGVVVDGQLIASPFDVPETYARLVDAFADAVVASLN